MSINYIENNIAKDEKILLSTNVCPWALWFLIVIWGLFALISFVVVAPVVGVILGSITLIIYFQFKSIQMVMTNKRIIIHEGIIATDTKEIRLEKCESINLKQGILGVIFNYGDIIFTGTGSSALVWHNISNPKEIRRRIEDVFETYGKK